MYERPKESDMSIDYARRNLENKQRELSRSGEKRAQGSVPNVGVGT